MPSDVPVGVPVFGVRFRLGVAGAALGLPAGEFLDGTVPVADVWGAEATTSGWPPAASRELVEVVRERLAGAPRRRRGARGGAGDGAPGRARGRARTLGVSERQLRRRFVDAVGYGPKTLARVLRFQRFLALAGEGEELARLALAAGYADQAHLTRETRRLAGRTPLELVTARAGPAGERPCDEAPR